MRSATASATRSFVDKLSAICRRTLDGILASDIREARGGGGGGASECRGGSGGGSGSGSAEACRGGGDGSMSSAGVGVVPMVLNAGMAGIRP